jgi:sugar phosphate permease
MPIGQRPGVFYGWVLVGTALTIIAVGMGLLFSLGIFMAPLEQSLGWSRGHIAQANLYGWIAFGISAFTFGLLSDRLGTRGVVRIGAVMLGTGMLGMSQMSRLWHFYLLYGALVGGAVGAFNVPLTAMVTRWFVRHRGMAVALANCGIGVGGMLFAPLSRVLIMSWSWRAAFVCFGVLVWTVVLPLTVLLRDRPQEMGLLPCGGRPPRHQQSQQWPARHTPSPRCCRFRPSGSLPASTFCAVRPILDRFFIWSPP